MSWRTELIPVEQMPRHVTCEPNEPVDLFDGQADVTIDGELTQKQVQVRLVWFPSPRVVVRVLDSGFGLPGMGDLTVTLPNRKSSAKVLWTLRSFSSEENESFMEGVLQNDALDDEQVFNRLVFHVVNGPEYFHTAKRNREDGGRFATRASLTTSEWNVSLDFLDDGGALGNNESADTRGYIISHVGAIERRDGQSFHFSDVETTYNAVCWLISFCKGAWAFPPLLEARTSNDSTIAESWSKGHVVSEQSPQSWFEAIPASGLAILPGIEARLRSDLWKEPIELALYWYLICNDARHTSIEGAIVLQQAAFELLAWTLLVEERCMLSEVGASNLPASDLIRLLLSECGIPLSITSGLAELNAVAKEYNWPDGPSATTAIRNAMVHAKPAKRRKVLGKGSAYRNEAWMLGQWYLELILLRLFDYSETYRCRLPLGDSQWEDSPVVPWAAASTPE